MPRADDPWLRQGALKICIYADDHAPPHFHLIRNGGGECLVSLADFTVMVGDVDRRDYERAIAWAEANRTLLEAKWRALNERG